MNNLSEHISYREAVYSDTAIRYGIPNDPNKDQLKRMVDIADNIFEPLRSGLGGKPINISSFFRSNDLNEIIHGAKNSQHKAERGAALDIDNDNFVAHGWPSNAEIFHYIKTNLDFDQLIWEFGNNDQPAWVHGSYNGFKNRGEILKAYKVGSITKYKIYA